MDTKKRGMWGETLALEFLLKKNYNAVDVRYRSRFGEIDIIVSDREYIVFVEVKLRKNSEFAEAREFVSKSKQQKIRSTALFWLANHDTALQPRFDVIEIYAQNGVKEKKPEIIHIENAF